MKLLLVDSMGLLYRGHFAMIRNPLTGPDGTVTSGLTHLLNETFSVLDATGATHACAVFDSHQPGFRAEISADYKAGRPPTPEELIRQAALAPDILDAMGVSVLQVDPWEADDLIATAARRVEEMGGSVVILSSDKDLLQLVSDRVSVLRPGRGGRPGRMVGRGEVAGELGVSAGQVADYLALAGDSSDNIPGAKGIGPKTAVRLLGEFRSLEGIYASIDSVSPASLRSRLLESREQVRLGRRLTGLRFDAPLPGDVGSMTLRTPDHSRALPLLERLGMHRLTGRVPVPVDADTDPCMVSDAESAASMLRESGASGRAFIWPLPHPADDIGGACGFSVSFPGGGDWFVDPSSLDPADGEAPGRLLERLAGGMPWASAGSKAVCRLLGSGSGPPCSDPLLADYVLRSGGAGRSLESLSAERLGRALPPLSPDFPTPVQACSRSRATLDLCGMLDAEVDSDAGMRAVYRDLELPLACVLASMESRGVGLDTAALDETGAGLRSELASTEERAFELLGFRINMNSPARVSEVLFEKLGLPRIRRTDGGGDSSGMTVLQALAGMHPFVALVSEHREISKLLSTYVDALPGFVSPRTGLVHTSFNQAVTATGRLSSSNPNLQNIPVRTPRGRSIRRCFRAGSPGDVLVSADYSQIELRILAHLAGDGALRSAYMEDADIHSRTAAAVFGDASPEHRRRAKEVNFSIVYGISPHGLAQRLGIERSEAAGIINRYFETYPEVEAFFRRCVAEAETAGETRTMFGRRRSFGDLASSRGNARRALERMAANTTVQGSAADLMKAAMIRAFRSLRAMPEAGLVLQVHDELVASCPREAAGEVSRLLVEAMEGACELAVPLRVECGWGSDWLEAHGSV